MNWRKRAVVALAVLALIGQGVFFLYSRTDHYRRHYGHAANRMAFYVKYEGQYLSTDEWAIKDWDQKELDKDKWAYSFDSDYGMYAFWLTWKGKTAKIQMENLNNWWRTIVIFEVSNESVVETDYHYNSVPPWTETITISW